MPIRILPDEVASQIAAGEVVERPASVVKELIENALDASAKVINVRIEGAGQRLIEVADDGCGIPAEELPLAVARHATSKLASSQDLLHITSLGFRGEALAAIGSVARMTLVSRPRGAESAGKLMVVGGHIGAFEPVGAPVGTQVIVEDLFYNVPARRKFLKKDVTERRQIDAIAARYALAYPNVRFRLTQEGRLSMQTSGNGDYREALAPLYGVEAARQMVEILAEEGDIRLSGFISPTTLTHSNRNEIIFFVNRRPVQDVALTAALVQAYHTLLMVGRFPLAALFLELPPEMVDINVHPTKAEVRFRERERLFSIVQRATRRALLAYTPLPEMNGSQLWSSQPQRSSIWSADISRESANSKSTSNETLTQSAQPVTQATLSGRLALLRPVGQVAATYLIAEGPDGLYLIDQHAAHERVLFEQMLAQRLEGMPAQRLLEPVSVELPSASARLIEEGLPVLKKIGFQIEEFGRNTFLVRALPELLAHMKAEAALRALVENFEEDETPLQNELENRIIARICKRAAIKAGQTLSPEEQRALIEALESCQSPRTCPHGRPTMIHLSVDLLERQFGRKGAR